MKIAIVGAGFFGIAAAIKLKEKYKNCKISIFEKNKDILSGSSGKNQFRWHKGYHYPRSQKTIEECLRSYKSFEKYLNKFTLDTENYYAISSENSLTSADQFINVCEKNKLYYKKTSLNILNKKKISSVFRVKEKIINIQLIKNYFKRQLKLLKIETNLNSEIKNIEKLRINYDFVILSTYFENEDLMNEKIDSNIKFQLVEKIISKVPKEYEKKSVVVLDGKFMCIDPFYLNKHSLLGTVDDSIIKETVGKKLQLNKLELSYLKKGAIINPQITNFAKIKKKFNEFFVGFDEVKYVKSFFVIRCTKVSKEDARNSEMKKKGNLIKIFSGKWVSCFKVAEKITKII